MHGEFLAEGFMGGASVHPPGLVAVGRALRASRAGTRRKERLARRARPTKPPPRHGKREKDALPHARSSLPFPSVPPSSARAVLAAPGVAGNGRSTLRDEEPHMAPFAVSA